MTIDEIRKGFSKASVVETPFGATVVYSRANAVNDWIHEDDADNQLEVPLRHILTDTKSLRITLTQNAIKMEFSYIEESDTYSSKVYLPLKKGKRYEYTEDDFKKTELSDYDKYLIYLHQKYNWEKPVEMKAAMADLGVWIDNNMFKPRTTLDLSKIRRFYSLEALCRQFNRMVGPFDLEILDPDLEKVSWDDESWDGGFELCIDCETLMKQEISCVVDGEALVVLSEIVNTADAICLDIRFNQPMFMIDVYP